LEATFPLPQRGGVRGGGRGVASYFGEGKQHPYPLPQRGGEATWRRGEGRGEVTQVEIHLYLKQRVMRIT